MRTSESICSLAHSPERGPEGGVGRADQFIFSLPFLHFSLFPLLVSQFPQTDRGTGAECGLVEYITLSSCSLIESTRDGYISGLAQTIWPHRILLSLSNSALRFSKQPILAHFPLHVYDKREWTYERKKKWVDREERKHHQCSVVLSCCSQESKISQVSRWMKMKVQKEQISSNSEDAAA